MKPKAAEKGDTGLLEYLEDIIGTDQYKESIEEAGQELEELNEKRQTYVSRAKIAGARCTPTQRSHYGLAPDKPPEHVNVEQAMRETISRTSGTPR